MKIKKIHIQLISLFLIIFSFFSSTIFPVTENTSQELLYEAILNDSGEGIEKAVQIGADINAKKAGMVPFLFALLNKKNKAVETLLKLNVQTDQSIIPYAISSQNIKTAFKLEQKHSKPNSLYYGKTLLEHALKASGDKNAQAIALKLILSSIKKNGSSYINKIEYGNTSMAVMEYAIKMYEWMDENTNLLAQEIIFELINRGYDINSIWSLGCNRLGKSSGIAIYNSKKALKLFLDKGADPNFTFWIRNEFDNWGMWSPLNLATFNYNHSTMKITIEILLEYGADINKKTPIDVQYTGLQIKGQHNPLSIAMARSTIQNYFTRAIEFLLGHGASL